MKISELEGGTVIYLFMWDNGLDMQKVFMSTDEIKDYVRRRRGLDETFNNMNEALDLAVDKATFGLLGSATEAATRRGAMQEKMRNTKFTVTAVQVLSQLGEEL